MLRAIFLILAITLSSQSFSEDYVYRYQSGEYLFVAEAIDACEDAGSSSPLFGECITAFMDFSKKKLDSQVDKLVSALSRDKSEFVASQERWQEFVKSQCQFESRASKGYSNSDRRYYVIDKECRYKLNLNRAKYLSEISYGCAGCVQ